MAAKSYGESFKGIGFWFGFFLFWWAVLTILLTILFDSYASAQPYYYAGITNTSKTAYQTNMATTMHQAPSCSRGVCHAIVWSILWDKGATGQYIEAGMGYLPRFGCKGKTPVGLFWATPAFPYGERVACVALGTDVVTSIRKNDGVNTALVTWTAGGMTVNQTVNLGSWYWGAGIHPTKVEVYHRYNGAPQPVHFSVAPAPLLPGDTAVSMQHTHPYYAIGDFTFYEVQY